MPGVQPTDRSIEAVARAFDEELRARLIPVAQRNWSPTSRQDTANIASKTERTV